VLATCSDAGMGTTVPATMSVDIRWRRRPGLHSIDKLPVTAGL
jgi:hypothetical protein